MIALRDKEESMGEWQPIETAPKDKRVDIWALRHVLDDPTTGKTHIERRRFPDCFWRQGIGANTMIGSSGGTGSHGANYQAMDSELYRRGWASPELREGWLPTHWMAIVDGPSS